MTHNLLFYFIIFVVVDVASIPIAAHIPIKVKEKIWANQFIRFHELLSPDAWAPSTTETEQHTSQEPAADKAGRQQNTKQEPLAWYSKHQLQQGSSVHGWRVFIRQTDISKGFSSRF